MFSIGKPDRPAVGSMAAGIQLCDSDWSTAGDGHPIDGVAKFRSEENCAIATPASAAKLVRVANGKRAAAIDLYGLELAVSGKADEVRIWRPERGPGVLGARQRMGFERIQRAHPQHGGAFCLGGDKSQ